MTTKPLSAWLALPARALRRLRLIERLSEHHVLFPAMALLMLGVIWGTTANLIRVERANAERSAMSSAQELGDTYEAQLLRNVREIDQTLKLVKYAYEASRDARVLGELRAKGLLPPNLLFTLSITDERGRIVASTRAAGEAGALTLPQEAVSAGADRLWLGQPRRDAASGEWKLDFVRVLGDARGGVAGAAVLAADAAYFVSSYEAGKLGERGLLGLVGSEDELYRVRRSGDALASAVPAQGIAPAAAEGGDAVRRAADGLDGTVRFTSVRPLYGLPLKVVVGLAEEEQFAGARKKTVAYVWNAAFASVLVLLFLAALARVSGKLAAAARREHEAKIAHAEHVHHLAYHDGLTGLPNRALFSRMLEHSIQEARRYGRRLGLLFLDLDRFKQINDTLGHLAGDHLLIEVSRRLRQLLRESDTVARLGGDEFVVLLPQFDEEKYIATVAHKLLHLVSEPFALGTQQLIVTTSIGIAVYPRDGADEQALMKCADAAMYHAKGEGKNNFQFYSSSLQKNSVRRLALETSLRLALERGELELHYQPKVDLASNRVTGVEALMRWRSPQHGLVPPGDFIPIAEDTGLIVPIGRWALEEACAQAVAWQERGLPPISIAVNMSARQFADIGIVEDIAAVLAQTRLDPALLELEITESLLMNDVDKAVRILTGLSAMRVRLAIDDFGTGYSSLSNLKRFPLTTLKIDRAFVSELPQDAEGRVLTEAIVSIGKALGMTVVAEGVETGAQAEFLRRQACDQYQGYYFSRPVVAAELAELLERCASEPVAGQRRAAVTAQGH